MRHITTEIQKGTAKSFLNLNFVFFFIQVHRFKFWNWNSEQVPHFVQRLWTSRTDTTGAVFIKYEIFVRNPEEFFYIELRHVYYTVEMLSTLSLDLEFNGNHFHDYFVSFIFFGKRKIVFLALYVIFFKKIVCVLRYEDVRSTRLV